MTRIMQYKNGQIDIEKMLKGRMAETLFEELLRRSGSVVYRFGYEAVVQDLTQLEPRFQKNTEVGERLRVMPDFVVINRDGLPSFVEVKFRKSGELFENDVTRLGQLARFWNAKFVLVNCCERPYFRIAGQPYFDRNKKFLGTPLLQENSWHIDRKLYEQCEELVHRYVAQTLIRPMR